MARWKKEAIVPPETIDYLNIIDEYNHKAFSFCVSHLFPLFNYVVLKECDVRPIDLKDQIMQMEHDYYGCDTADGLNITILCCHTLSAYYENMINITPDSRAEKYHKHGLNIVNAILDGKDISLQRLEDALLIMIALLRQVKGHIGDDKVSAVTDADIDVKIADVAILQELWELMMSACDPSRPSFLKRRVDDIETQQLFTMAHVIFVVLFCHMLQQRGVFSSEDM